MWWLSGNQSPQIVSRMRAVPNLNQSEITFMATERGTSIVPLVLGAVGAALQLPGAVCGGFCGAVVSEIQEKGDAATQAAAQDG